MTVRIDIRLLGERELARELARFSPQVAQVATVHALNRTVNNMRSKAIKLSAKWLGVPGKLIKKRFNFNTKLAHGAIGIVNAKRQRLEAKGVALGRPFNLIRWGAQRTPQGVTAHAWGKTKHYEGLSIASNPAPFVFVISKSGKGPKRIKRGAYGPGLTDAMTDPTVAAAVKKEGEDKFTGHFVSRANRALERAGWRPRLRVR